MSEGMPPHAATGNRVTLPDENLNGGCVKATAGSGRQQSRHAFLVKGKVCLCSDLTSKH